jgi:hypothetical protein
MSRTTFILTLCYMVTSCASPPESPQQKCNGLISTYRLALERAFEVELNSLRSPDALRRDWYQSLKNVGVTTYDSNGHPRDPAVVVGDTLVKLTKVQDADDRRRLEYALFGTAMPLEARRDFETYCVAVKNQP